MKYLSVCSGIEAASVAWHPLGWEPLAFSEIEPFPRAVLEHHYPDVPCHGDFTVLRNEPWIVDADVLVGGTPCQAFSVAGLRKSLGDDRGNLSLEFIKLADSIDAAREAHRRDPSVIVWENVPGVLSVKDNAFGCFLAGLAGDVDPYDPPRGKWTNAGVVDGPARTVAWRILDAQYFGLAQRRRRVFVVASARAGFDPAAVLLEFEGVRRDTPPRREAGKGTAHATAPCLTSSGRGVERTGDTRGQDPVVAVEPPYQVANCLTQRMHKGINTTLDEGQTPILEAVTHSLRAEGFDASEDGTGRGTPLVPVAFSYKDSGNDATVDCSPTLRSLGAYDANGGGQMAVAFHPTQDPISSTDGSTDGSTHALGCGSKGGQASVAVAVSLRGRDGGGTAELGGDVQNALRASQGGGDKPHVLATCFDWKMGEKARSIAVNEEQAPTLGAQADRYAVQQHMAVRRLTPRECEALQGFPADYTLIPWKKKPAEDCPDGPRYKALGNSMAVPCMRWIGRRIAEALR